MVLDTVTSLGLFLNMVAWGISMLALIILTARIITGYKND